MKSKTTRHQKSISKRQLFLHSTVTHLFPAQIVKLNHIHPTLRYARNNRHVEFDIFITELNLALEYQGEQHFHQTNIYGSLQFQKMRDKEKREKCERSGITLIEVPYWWDGKKESLMATINKKRPELFPSIKSSPIPDKK